MIHIRAMTFADVPFADSLRDFAGWNQTVGDWRRFLDLEPGGCFVAEKDGAPAGVATAVTYGEKIAWIGMVLVHPNERGRGIGTALLEHCLAWLRKRKVPCIKLDATPAGQPIYERLGFRTEWPLARWEGIVGKGAAAGIVSDRANTIPGISRPGETPDFTETVLLRIRNLDAEAFGAGRERLVAGLVSGAEAVAWMPAETGNEAISWGVLRRGSRAMYAGPIVAANADSGVATVEILLRAASGRLTFLDVPEAQIETVALLESLGFCRQRPFTRMFLGENIAPGNPSNVFAIADPALG